jgi:hypothetical protein
MWEGQMFGKEKELEILSLKYLNVVCKSDSGKRTMHI